MKSPCMFLQLWLFCILLMFSFLCLDKVRGECLEHHKSLLLDFKRSLVIGEPIVFYFGIEPHIVSKLPKWNASTNCCLWPGVTCSGRHVTGLDLGMEPIVGGFNDSSPLFQLTSLTSLTLAWMEQETVIPSGIGKLVNLMHLDLYSSKFIGQIPIEISNLTRLVSLDLSKDYSYDYSFKVENPNLRMLVGNLSNLVDLRLKHVDLSSESRQWCQTLSSSTPRLQVLDLGYCRLSGPIHDSLQNLTNLSIVDLSSNNFSGPIPFGVFSNLKNLTSLTLRSYNFNGEFSHTILQLPTLRYLDMSYNSLLEASPSITLRNISLEILLLSMTHFWKTIPESLGEARMLSWLDLSHCKLPGQIPKSISQHEHLVHLDLSGNNLEGHIPSFSRSKSLIVLDLSYNRLHGSILGTDWEMLLHMEILSLGSNNLSGSIPKCLFETPSLSDLNLKENHFSGFTNESNVTTSSSRLLKLRLDDNYLQGTFPSFVFGLSSLQYLDLSFNSFSTFPLGSFIKLPHGNNFSFFPHFKILRLASCNLKEFPPFLANQFVLESLDLSGNQIAGQVPDHIWNVSRSLDLSSNKLYGSITKSFCNMTSLFILYLSNNLFSGTLPLQCSTRFETLSFLNLRNNNFCGTIPDMFASTILLQMFDLSQNSFQGKIPKSLGGCRFLHMLNLGYNKLHDMFPCWINNLDQLRVLVLRSNSFYGSIECLNHNFNRSRLHILDIASNEFVRSILHILDITSNGFGGSRLHIVDIASNEFDGKLPSQGLRRWEAMMAHEYPDHIQIYYDNKKLTDTTLVTVKGLEWYLTKISSIYTVVDFSNNKFEGDIPHELGELNFLYALNLSHNYLSGKIPPSLGNLSHIESMDLSANELSGKIPDQFAALTFLEVLNLSFNHLEGMIPKGRQFQTFSKDSFKGNKGLCGQPLNISCGNEGTVSNPPDPLSEAEAEEDYGDILIATQVGYTLGFGLIVMPLIFWSTWRKRYYECIDRVLMNILCRQSKESPPPRQINRTN